MIPMLNLPRMHAPFEGELKAAFDAMLSSGRFINGPAVTRFEEELAACVVEQRVLARHLRVRELEVVVRGSTDGLEGTGAGPS